MLDDGRLSLEQAALIARHVPGREPVREPARFTTGFDGVGGFGLRRVGAADAGALIEAAFKEARAVEFRPTG